jgi:hypothetical protein
VGVYDTGVQTNAGLFGKQPKNTGSVAGGRSKSTKAVKKTPARIKTKAKKMKAAKTRQRRGK